MDKYVDWICTEYIFSIVYTTDSCNEFRVSKISSNGILLTFTGGILYLMIIEISYSLWKHFVVLVL